MLKRKFVILALLGSLFAMIFFVLYRRVGDGAEVIVQGPGRHELRFWTHSWQVPFGVHGGRDFRGTEPYEAALIGSGPVFTNPVFLDISSDERCLGYISLDLEHNRVTVDMERVVSDPRLPEQSKPHPANATYKILSVRKALPLEQEVFDEWLTNRSKN